MDFPGAALAGTEEAVVRDNAHGGRTAVRDIPGPFGDESHPVVEHEDPGRVWCAGDLRQPVDAGPHGAAAQDVVDEGAIDPGHL